MAAPTGLNNTVADAGPTGIASAMVGPLRSTQQTTQFMSCVTRGQVARGQVGALGLKFDSTHGKAGAGGAGETWNGKLLGERPP